ncbi:DUF3598 family protein [Tumidithrix elongata RA019]|uniref:DUF3598 family protein n=1 Tax=Tumidithrix elongata BACA0141 TaxID=2716417 RepID=A0AAW9Q4P2_9CYAN|nr:DUF3598 family protein [Tumidithrix elongata RA019]
MATLKGLTQWECLLLNLGCWQGSFTRLSPQGELREDIKSETILEGLDSNKTIQQTIRQFYPDRTQEKVLTYSSLGRNILLFENGAFSQGSIQLGFQSEFGAEFGLIDRTRRLRLVQLFNKEGNLDSLTLIREHLPESNIPERPPLKLESLLGHWQGEAITIYPDWRSEIYPTASTWSQQDRQVSMTLRMGSDPSIPAITSIATIHDSNPNILNFEPSLMSGDLSIQTLFLPDGSSSTSPTHLKLGQPFRLAASWLVQPDLHQRVIRSYNAKGEWIGLTFVAEQKIT